jgi:hypothetical protein
MATKPSDRTKNSTGTLHPGLEEFRERSKTQRGQVINESTGRKPQTIELAQPRRGGGERNGGGGNQK